MNLLALVDDQQLHIDETEYGWEWAVFHLRRDRQIKAGVAKSLDLAKIAAAGAAEAASQNITWKLIGSGIAGRAVSIDAGLISVESQTITLLSAMYKRKPDLTLGMNNGHVRICARSRAPRVLRR